MNITAFNELLFIYLGAKLLKIDTCRKLLCQLKNWQKQNNSIAFCFKYESNILSIIKTFPL